MTRSRRQLLAAFAAAVPASIAGCVAGSSGEEPEPAPAFPQDREESLEAVSIEAPETAPVDESIDVRVEGIEPGSEVAIESSTLDDEGGRWYGRGTYVAADGTVDPSTDRSIEGTYTGVDGTGLVWSMEPGESATGWFSVAEESELVLAVRRDGDLLGSTTIARTLTAPGVERTDLEDDPRGFVVEPEAGSGPGVVVLGSGRLEARIAAALANRGFVALALRFYGGEGRPTDIVEIPVEYVDLAADRLRAREDVDGDRIGLVGHSTGGEFALVAGSFLDGVGAVVGYNASGLVWQAHGNNETSAWTVDGEPLPYVTYPMGHEDPLGLNDSPYDMFEAGLEAATERELEAATIPVERIDGPVFLASGRDDGVRPSAAMSDVAIDRLEATDHPHPFEHRVYDDAGHVIEPPHVPTTGRDGPADTDLGGTPAGIARANADGWRRTLETLRSGLDSG